MNFCVNYSGARDDFVYIYSPDSDSAYEAVDRLVLARVSRMKIRERDAYEFFTGLHAGEHTFTCARRSLTSLSARKIHANPCHVASACLWCVVTRSPS